MKSFLKIFTFILLLPTAGLGQMPTSVIVNLNPPSPLYIGEYYSFGSQALTAQLTLNDLQQDSWDVRLKVTIEGEGIKISTKQNFRPLNRITLFKGLTQIIEGDGFAEYLNVNNVDLEGITAASLNQSGKLPEGHYVFSVEILDYNTGIPLSFPDFKSAFIFFEPPPVTLQPACESVITPTDPVNLYFTWQIAGGSDPSIAMSSKYQLSLYEITEDSQDPYFAVENNHALLIYQSDFINQTSLSIDQTSMAVSLGTSSITSFTPGKKYIYRVQAKDEDEGGIYRNEGFSEWCWFFYGYPHDGNLAITTPADEYIFGKYDNKVFGWEASDLGTPGQEYDYTVVVKVLNEGQEKERAMDENPDWYVKNIPTTSSLNGYGFTLDQDTEPGTTYIWQVIAHTGVQEVAKSEIYTFYSAPLVDEFYVGGNLVKVVSLTNTDLSNLSGVGRIQISNDETDVFQFDFKDLTIEEVGVKMVLTAGEEIFEIPDREPMVLEPSDIQNENANFNITQGKITTEGIQLMGYLSTVFPLATSNGELSYIKSEQKWFRLNPTYQMLGEATLSETVEYELLEPYEFIVSLSNKTKFVIDNEKYSLYYSGSIGCNNLTTTNDGLPYTIPFNNQASIYYLEASGLSISVANYITPLSAMNIAFVPKSVIVDLSENQSPDKLSGQPQWKGFYFPEYSARFYSNNIDASNQLALPSNLDKNETLDNTDFWISTAGLHLDYPFTLESEGTTFNQFATIVSGNLTIEDNQVTNSKLEGEIKIPVIDKIDGFEFEIPITNDGLAQGYLREDLTQREMVFNPYGGENKVDISINRAVFADNERIDLEIDAELVGISALATGISDFRIYGDNSIGFGSKGGSKALDTQVEGEYKGFAAYVQEVGAALYNGNYAFSYVAAMDMGDDVVGEGGPPLLPITSIEPVGDDVVVPTYGPSTPQPEPSIAVPADIDPSSSTLTSNEMYVGIDNALVNLEGYLKLTNNDPNWGTSFRGGITGSIKIPTTIEVGANMIFGNREGLKFWYFDAYFNDREGLGIPVAPFFNIVAMEGKVFHHMSKSEGEYIVDPELAFGAGLYMQIIDNPTSGALFAIDAGMEIKIQESGDFTFSMNGDGSFLNTNRRSAASGGVASAVGDAVIEEALEAIGPISLSFDVAGGELSVTAEGTTKGRLDYIKGDLELGFGADLGAIPGVDFNFKKGGGNIDFNANASGEFGIGLGLDGNLLSLGIEGSNSAYLDFAYDNVSFSTDVNRANKTGSLAFSYDDLSIDFGKETDGGYLNFALSDDLKFNTGFNTAGSAYLGLTAGINVFNIAGDKAAGTGMFSLDIDGLEMSTSVNTQEKSASFGLNTSGVVLNVDGAYGKGGSFLLDAGGAKFDIGANLENKTGHIDFTLDDNRLFAELTEDNQGSLLFKTGPTEFGISGNTAGTAGKVFYKDNSASFSIAADRDNKTGGVDLTYGSNTLSSGLSPDSSYINLGFSGMALNLFSDNKNAGMIELINGSDQIKVEADLEAKSGSILLTDGSNSIFAKGAANATGEIKLNLDNNKIEAVKGLSESSLFVGSGQYEFSLEGANDGSSGLIGMKVGSLETRLGIDIAQSAGEIFVGDGADFILLKGNKTENTGMIDLKKSIVEFTAIYDDSLHMYSGPLSLTKFSNGTGNMKYFKDGNEIALYKKSDELGIGMSYSGNDLYLAHGTTKDLDSVYYRGNGQTVTASLVGNTGRVGVLNSLGYFGLVASNDGTGALSFNRGDWGAVISANVNDNTGHLELTKGDMMLDGNANISTKAYDVGFEKGSILTRLYYEPGKKTINFGVLNNFDITAIKEGENYTTEFVKGEHHLKGKVEGTLKEIEYNGMGAKVILGNQKEYVSYGGHSVLIENEKVFVDEEEVYDYSSVSMTDVLDLRKVNWKEVNLKGMDFSGIDLKGMDLSGIDFSKLDLPNVNLKDINFTGIDFMDVDLSALDFTGIDLSGLDLSGLNFTGFDLSMLDVSMIDFTGIDLSGFTLPNIDLSRLNLSGIDFSGFSFEGIDISMIDLSGVDFGSLDLSGIDLSSLGDFDMIDLPTLDLSGIDFTGLDLSSLDLSMIDFTGIDLTGISLPNIDWPSINLSGIDFSGFGFPDINLAFIDFSGIDFSGISLAGLNFTGFDFGNINLSFMDFSGFGFPGLDLSFIDFSGLDWPNIDLSMIDFSGFDFPNIDLSMFDFSGINFPSMPDLNWTMPALSFDDVEIIPYLNGKNSAITFIKGADSVHVRSVELKDGAITAYISGKNIEVKKEGAEYALRYEDYTAELKGKDLVVKQGETNQLHITPEAGSLVYDNYEVSLSKEDGFSYSDGYNKATVTNEGIAASSGEKELSFNKQKQLFIQYEQGKNFKIDPAVGLEVNYDGSALTVTEELLSYSDSDREYKVSPEELSITEGDKKLIVNENRGYLEYDSKNSLELTGGVLTAIHDDKTFTISDQKEITYNDPNRELAISPDAMYLEQDGKSVSLSAEEMQIILAEDQKLKLTESLLDLKYNENELKLGSSALYFTDGSQTFDLSKDELAISKNDNSIFLSKTGFGLNYGSNHINIDKQDQKVDFKYGNVEAAFSNGESLSFTDGTRSFELASTGLSMQDGDNTLAVVDDNGKQALELTSGDDRFFVNNSGFAIDYSGKHFAINDEEYLHVDIDANRYIEVMNNGAKYSDNGTELIIGGDENFLEVKDGTKSIALTQDEKLTLKDGKYSAWLSKDLEIEMTDGIRTIGLFSESHYVTYQQGEYEFGIRGGSGGNKPGLDVTAYGNTIIVEGERNKDVTVGVSSPDYGEVSFTINSEKDIEARFVNGSSVYGFIKDEAGITPITGSEPAPPEPENLEGSGSVVAMDGPSHLTNSIADEGGGSIRGTAELSFDSRTSHFVANAAVAGNAPICIEGAMALEVSPEKFKLNIGTEAQKIEVYPTCSGFGGGGWLGIESTSATTSIDLGVFVGWKAGASVEIGSDAIGAGLSVEAAAELGVKAKAELLPDFKLLEAGIWLDLYVAIKAKYWALGVSGSCTLAEAGLHGELLAKFLETETQVSGKLSGYITVLDIISASFDMSFNTSF